MKDYITLEYFKWTTKRAGSVMPLPTHLIRNQNKSTTVSNDLPRFKFRANACLLLLLSSKRIISFKTLCLPLFVFKARPRRLCAFVDRFVSVCVCVRLFMSNAEEINVSVI